MEEDIPIWHEVRDSRLLARISEQLEDLSEQITQMGTTMSANQDKIIALGQALSDGVAAVEAELASLKAAASSVPGAEVLDFAPIESQLARLKADAPDAPAAPAPAAPAAPNAPVDGGAAPADGSAPANPAA